jgi:hypothetical protein
MTRNDSFFFLKAVYGLETLPCFASLHSLPCATKGTPKTEYICSCVSMFVCVVFDVVCDGVIWRIDGTLGSIEEP